MFKHKLYIPTSYYMVMVKREMEEQKYKTKKEELNPELFIKTIQLILSHEKEDKTIVKNAIKYLFMGIGYEKNYMIQEFDLKLNVIFPILVYPEIEYPKKEVKAFVFVERDFISIACENLAQDYEYIFKNNNKKTKPVFKITQSEIGKLFDKINRPQ